MVWWKHRDAETTRAWVAVGAVAGLTAITRWQDAAYLCIPFAYDFESGNRRTPCAVWLRTRIVYMGAIALFLFPQLWQWHTLYGRWLLVPQGPAFVSFPPRYVLNVLFSDLHGWFLWTPLT